MEVKITPFNTKQNIDKKQLNFFYRQEIKKLFGTWPHISYENIIVMRKEKTYEIYMEQYRSKLALFRGMLILLALGIHSDTTLLNKCN